MASFRITIYVVEMIHLVNKESFGQSLISGEHPCTPTLYNKAIFWMHLMCHIKYCSSKTKRKNQILTAAHNPSDSFKVFYFNKKLAKLMKCKLQYPYFNAWGHIIPFSKDYKWRPGIFTFLHSIWSSRLNISSRLSCVRPLFLGSHCRASRNHLSNSSLKHLQH